MINFPIQIDSLNNVAGKFEDDAGFDHESQHDNANDAIEALETKMGIDNSTDPTSITYKISQMLNASDPTSLAYQIAHIVTASVGDIKWSIRTVAESGWLLLSGGTIGDASSNGTIRANADTSALFTLLWTGYADAELPIYNSVGTLSSRGASAAADFAAHKKITLPDPRGQAMVPYKSGDADFGTMGKSGGVKSINLQHLHSTGDFTMLTANMPAHVHNVDPPATNSGYISSDHSHYVNGVGDHSHQTRANFYFHVGTGGGTYVTDYDGAGRGNSTSSNGAHDHGWTGGVSANHYHTVDIGAFDSASTGGSSPHNHGNTNNQLSTTQSILNPYLVLGNLFIKL